VIALGVLVLAQAAAGGPSPAYRDLVERYRRGEQAAVTTGALPALPAALDASFPFEAAVLLHTDRAMAAAARGGDELEELGRALLLTRRMPPERRRAFAPRWLRVPVLRLCRQARWPQAFGLLNEGLGLRHDDPELLMLRGAVIESQLRMGPALRGAAVAKVVAVPFDVNWTGAEALYRRVLAARPDLTEARLRLGRVRQLLTRGRDTVELRAVAKGPATPDQLYLAHLFLGAAFEQKGDEAGAAAEFEAAARAFPGTQSAAVALSHARRRAGEWEAAASALGEGLATPGAPLRRDPWWAYQAGQAEDADALLDSLRAEVRQ